MQQFDFSAYSSEGQLALIAEAKVRRGTGAEWARQLRRNLLADTRIAPDAMFLLATPEALYLWKAGSSEDDFATYELKADALFRPYFERVGVDPGRAIDPGCVRNDRRLLAQRPHPR